MTRTEQETIITYNEAERMANIYTYNQALKAKLLRLCKERPKDITHDSTSKYGGMEFTLPKKWVRITPTRILSDKAREQLSQLNAVRKHQF